MLIHIKARNQEGTNLCNVSVQYVSFMRELSCWLWICNFISVLISIIKEGLVLTLSILPCPQGWISWSTSVDGLMMRRMSILHQKISLPLRFPSGFALRKSLGRQGWIFQYLPRFGGAHIQSSDFINSKHEQSSWFFLEKEEVVGDQTRQVTC